MKTSVLCLFVHFWLPLLGKAAPKREWIELSYQFNSETIYWPNSLAFKHIRLSENFIAAGFYYSAYDSVLLNMGEPTLILRDTLLQIVGPLTRYL